MSYKQKVSQEEREEISGQIAQAVKEENQKAAETEDANRKAALNTLTEEFKEQLGLISNQVAQFISAEGIDPETDDVETWGDKIAANRKSQQDLADATAAAAGDFPDIGVDGINRKMYDPRLRLKRTKNFIGYDAKAADYDGLDDAMDLNDKCYIATKAILFSETGLDVPVNDPRYIEMVKGLKSYQQLQDEMRSHSDLRKALDTATAGEGAEWIPTELSAQMLDAVRLELQVAAQFNRVTIPRATFEMPVRGARSTAFLVGEATADASSKLPTANVDTSLKVTFAAKVFGVRTLWSRELDEDSIIAVFPMVQSELVQALADAEENSIINGDTASTHQHSDVTAANDARKAFDGLLKNSGGSSGNAAVDISTYTLANQRNIRKAMGKYGVRASALRYAMSISAYIQTLAIAEVLTLDKYGQFATVVQGELARIDDIPIIVSEFIRQDLNTSGVYDGATVTDTEILLFNAGSFIIGDVRGITSDSRFDIETQQNVLVQTRRMDFKQIHSPGTGEETVGLGYSLTA